MYDCNFVRDFKGTLERQKSRLKHSKLRENYVGKRIESQKNNPRFDISSLDRDPFIVEKDKTIREIDSAIANKLNPYLKYNELDSVKAFVSFGSNEGRDLCLM